MMLFICISNGSVNMSNHDKIDELVELGSRVWKDMIEDIISGYTQIIVEALEEYKNDRTDEANRREG